MSYLYIRDNEWYKQHNVYKVGITTSIKDRDNTYITGEIVRGTFIKIYELIDKNEQQLKKIDDDFKKYFKEYNIYKNSGTEFYDTIIINLIDEYLLKNNIEFKLINEDDLRRITKEKTIDEYPIFNQLILPQEYNLSNDELRDYQIDIINQSLSYIKNNNSVYISLPTGGGKSFISYKIFNELNKNIISTIIILTPRINIYQQNIKDRYLKLLSNTYKIYNKDNLDKIKNNENNIICCCINSYKKIVEIIKKANLRNIIIWFDEAHYGIENWFSEQSNEYKIFILENKEYIKYRLFTSASPNKDIVIDYKYICGEFINPYNARYLIDNGYLCDLKVSIFKENIIDNISIDTHINLIIKNFDNKNNGLCFCNSCDNALELFLKHLELYDINNNIPKPYLLLNSEKIKEYYNIYKINQNLLNIDCFEKDGGIAYIVNMYSMGYDNPKIDFIYFKDPKLSYKDIIQSIGRGLRPYEDKITHIYIPVYINNDDDANNYNKIKEVIKYLLIDLELNIKDINIFNNNKKKLNDFNTKDNNDIKFIEEIETIIYNIQNTNITKDSITRQLKYNNIHNYNHYLRYINENLKLNFPENLFEMFPSFDFNNTYNKNLSPYYSREECIKMIKIYEDDVIFEENIDKENNSDLLEFLTKKDKKIPNECLWFYYGGAKKDFIIFV
jgi:superfamily II DNA or RNA helicase